MQIMYNASFFVKGGSRLINDSKTSYEERTKWNALKGNFSFVIPLTSYAHARTQDDDGGLKTTPQKSERLYMCQAAKSYPERALE